MYFRYFCRCLFTSKEPCASWKGKIEITFINLALKVPVQTVSRRLLGTCAREFQLGLCIDFLENPRKSFWCPEFLTPWLVLRCSSIKHSYFILVQVSSSVTSSVTSKVDDGVQYWSVLIMWFQLVNGIQWTKFCFAPDHFWNLFSNTLFAFMHSSKWSSEFLSNLGLQGISRRERLNYSL